MRSSRVEHLKSAIAGQLDFAVDMINPCLSPSRLSWRSPAWAQLQPRAAQALPRPQAGSRRSLRALAEPAGDDEPSTSGRPHRQPQLSELDLNQLQTALNTAIAAENYTLAAKIRDVLQQAAGADPRDAPADWRRLGILDWLAERAEYLGYKMPTGGWSWG